jgi:hypothetical protein
MLAQHLSGARLRAQQMEYQRLKPPAVIYWQRIEEFKLAQHEQRVA